eukprot:scaffold5645_cov183-Ochromonas_danica.AAC.3
MESMESIFVMLSKIEMSGDSTLLVTNPISNSELNALYAIYNATNGQSWTYFSGNPWNFSEIYPDPCGDKWQGLTCSTLCNTTACSQVIAIIDLDNMNLVGTLPVEIGDFSQLVALTISNNVRLAGTLPDSLGNLSSLLLLDFTNNLLSGTLPTTLGQLNLLADLTIMSSSLRGKPPQEIYTLTSLHTLTLTNSYFTGSIPLAIVNLTNLEELTLSGCQFTGNVPEEMNQLTSLISIDLTNNYLTGTLSPWLLTNLTNLQSFIIYGNRISGPIPNITTKSSLTLIDMGYNRLTGTLPVSISLGQYLTGVFLEENDLTGTIPPEWGSLSLLWDLYLNDNALRGNIPSTLQNLQNLKILSLSNNINIIGTIPMGLGNITGLQHLLLSDCSLTGSLPSGLGSQKYLYELDVGLNYLTGNIPGPLKGGKRWQALDLSYNKLEGTLTPTTTTNDDNDDNDDDDNEFNSTSSIYLNINRLSGRIPGFYYDISSPGDLNMLRGNLFTCPTMNLKSHLPQSDPYHTEYDCGSDSLNTALLIWLGLISFVVGLLYLIYTMFRRSTSTTQSDSNSSELPSSSSTIISSCGSVVKGSRPWKRLQEWMRDLLYWQEGNEERWKMEVSNTAVSHRQSDLDKCNTQTEEGTMISMTTNQASQQERKIVSTRHDASFNSSLLDDNRGNNGSNNGSNTVNNPCHIIKESQTTTTSPSLTSITSIPPHSNNTDDSNDNDDDTEGGWSTFQEEEQENNEKLDWKVILSAILVDYAYVFAYKYVLIGVLYPLLIATIICFEGRTEEEEEKNVSKHGERLIDWRRLLPTLWKRSARSVASTTGSNQPQDSGSLSSSSQGGIVFFSAAEYAIRLVMMLSCLLTFGVTIPYLAILIGFSIVSNTYLVQLGWLYQWKHRMLTAGQQVNDSSSFTQLCKQCGRLFHCMRLALPPMIFFLPLFFAYFLFDTAGDKGGWVMGLCFALSLVAVCILVSCSLVFILWHWTSWMRTVTMSHEDSKKNEVCEAEEGPPCVAPPAPSEEESKTQSVSQDSTNIELASTSLVSSSLVNDDSAFVTNAMHHRSC